MWVDGTILEGKCSEEEADRQAYYEEETNNIT